MTTTATNEHEEPEHQHQVLNMEQIKVVCPLGRGAKGVVLLVKDEPIVSDNSGELWALKVVWRELVEKRNINKETINDWREYRRIYFEQQVLSHFNHPLLPKLRGVLSTEKVVAYAIDYCPGRDLNYLRKQQSEQMFSVDFIRFYAAELVLALEYLHSLSIAYRDLKPENIMIQENGHVMLVDFDLSTKLSPATPQSSSNHIPVPKPPTTRKKWLSPLHRFCNSGVSPDDTSSNTASHLPPPAESDSSEKSKSFVGTEEYVAPEIIQGLGHDFAVDWWSLGVVLYEMLYGKTPFRGANRKETFFRILTKTPQLVGEATPLRDLIGKLLIRDPKQRIGLEEIKGHDFFKGIDWDLLLQMSRPPYIPDAENHESEEDREVKTRIDVEEFVHRVLFASGEVGNRGTANDGEEENNADKEVDSNHIGENDNFLGF